MPLQQTILGNLTSLKVRKSYSIFWGNNISKVQLRGKQTSAMCAVIFNYKGILGMCLLKNFLINELKKKKSYICSYKVYNFGRPVFPIVKRSNLSQLQN